MEQVKRKYVRRNVKIRDPQPSNRDPIIEQSEPTPAITSNHPKPRRYIAASMPTVCPDCGHNTRMADGRHVDPVRRRILEYRTCSKCGALLAAGRPMTEREAETLCTRAQAIKEYEETEARI